MIEENKTQNGFKASHIIIIVLVAALIWVIWSNYNQETKLESANDQAAVVGQSLNNTKPPSEVDAAAVEAEIEALLAQFGKLILFPTTERPQLATIEDAEALAAENLFFSGSQAGDKVLIYSQSGKAYVLSPTRQLVVNVGPIVNEPAPSEPVQATTDESEAVEVE